MTRMLAAVSGPEEATLALAGGADVIDLKDPTRGALGAVDPAMVRATVALVAGRRPVSAATGEMPMQPDTVLPAARAMAAAGADMVEQGIFPGGAPKACIGALAPLAARTRLVAVLFADRAPDFGLLPLLAEHGFAGAMLDTAEKGGRGLLDATPLPRLREFLAACRAHGLQAGLAGALEPPDVPRLLLLGPDVLGFRGALCRAGDRRAALDLDAVQAIRGLIPPEAAPGSAVDYRLLAARGYGHDSGFDPTKTDRIFVHDLVLPARIGAYAREVATPQPVRFSVDVWVARVTRPTQDMRDVFSYDVIADGIRMLVDAGHVALVETLAERIAAMLLEHPRVIRVRVQVEKLDTGSGIVGVAIERDRPAAAAHPGAAPRVFGAERPE
jgi:dihydroneopterin aldolase